MMKKRILSLGVLIICNSIIFTGCNKDNSMVLNGNTRLAQMAEDGQSIKLQLYFDASKDEDNVEISSEDRTLITDEFMGEVIMLELIKGPSGESSLKPIFPKETNLLSFSINENIAYVNLSEAAQYSMTKAKEEVVLKSLAASLVQLESVESIKLLIANNNIETIGGNFDTSKPFTAETLVLLNKSE
ncbi:GerMN domain-containing protein [Clostridium sp. DL1XJH146]